MLVGLSWFCGQREGRLYWQEVCKEARWKQVTHSQCISPAASILSPIHEECIFVMLQQLLRNISAGSFPLGDYFRKALCWGTDLKVLLKQKPWQIWLCGVLSWQRPEAMFMPPLVELRAVLPLPPALWSRTPLDGHTHTHTLRHADASYKSSSLWQEY